MVDVTIPDWLNTRANNRLLEPTNRRLEQLNSERGLFEITLHYVRLFSYLLYLSSYLKSLTLIRNNMKTSVYINK